MPKANRERSKIFKRLRATVFAEDDQVGVSLNDLAEQFNLLTVFAKPRKVAKELRRIARWLEKK